MLTAFLIISLFYSFLYLFLNNGGLGLYMIFNFSSLMAIHLGLFLWAIAGANFSHTTLLLLIIFTFCSASVFILALYLIKPRINFKAFYLDRVHYFKNHIHENIRFLVACLIFSVVFTYYQMYLSGNFFREFYRSLVMENKMLYITLVSSLASILCIFFLLEKKYLYAFLMCLILVSLGKKNPLFIIFLLITVHYLVTRNEIFRPIMISLISVVSLVYLAMAHSNQSSSILSQLTSSLDYVYNFDYFVENFQFGSLQGAIFKSEFIRYIPRLLWSEKPELYGSVLIHETLYPAEIAIGYFPSTFEAYTKYLADFGIFGLVIFMLIKIITYMVFFWSRSFWGVIIICFNLDSNLLPFLFMIFMLTKLKRAVGLRKTKHMLPERNI
jgi:hypothetical protein